MTNSTNGGSGAAAGLVNLKSLSHKELAELIESLGQPSFRTKQVEDWIWNKHVSSLDEMTNLPKTLREALAAKVSVGGVEEVARQVSSDGSHKYLLRYPAGGCAMGCAFCATGAAGLTRSLTSAEIYEQVMHVRDDFNTRVTSVVLMGQGEPFMNYDATLGALRKLNNPDGGGIGARHLTVSTCGVIPNIIRFAKEPEQFTLAVSLHSAVQSTRNALMPGVKKYSLVNLYNTMGEYVNKTGRRPTYEYALIGGVNDTGEELSALCDFCKGTLAHVNLIQLNEVSGSKFKPSTPQRAQDFVQRLARVGVEATIRNSRGSDIDAACGQLRQRIAGK